jgi:hypothetical protein
MFESFFRFCCCACLATSVALSTPPQRAKEPVDYVDPYIGSIGHLLTSTSPSVQYPYGMVRLAPVASARNGDRYFAHDISGFPAGAATLMATTGALALGESVAADEAVFRELLPELVSHNGQLWSFGRGLARRAADPVNIWDRLLDALAATAEGWRRIQVLCGFMHALHETSSEVAGELLDLALQDERSAPTLPAFQAVVGIDQRGVGRLMSALSSDLTPVGNYQGLIIGGPSDSIPAEQFKDLVVMIASKPGGFDVAADILNRRLHQEKTQRQKHTAEVIDAGRHLIRQMPFTKECNSHRDYSWGQIIRSCLVGDIGAAIVKDVCRRLKEAVSAYTAYSFYNDDLIAGLFAVHSTTALDAFCGGELKQLEQGLRMIQDLRQNPLDECRRTSCSPGATRNPGSAIPPSPPRLRSAMEKRKTPRSSGPNSRFICLSVRPSAVRC